MPPIFDLFHGLLYINQVQRPAIQPHRRVEGFNEGLASTAVAEWQISATPVPCSDYRKIDTA
jgi:hypothetical protein